MLSTTISTHVIWQMIKHRFWFFPLLCVSTMYGQSVRVELLLFSLLTTRHLLFRYCDRLGSFTRLRHQVIREKYIHFHRFVGIYQDLLGPGMLCTLFASERHFIFYVNRLRMLCSLVSCSTPAQSLLSYQFFFSPYPFSCSFSFSNDDDNTDLNTNQNNSRCIEASRKFDESWGVWVRIGNGEMRSSCDSYVSGIQQSLE